MLNALSVSTPSGLVLWSKSYNSDPNAGSAPLNSLVQEVLLNNERTGNGNNRHDKDAQSCMWTLANDLGLIFVVVWPRILHLTYLDKLLDTMKTLFISMFGDLVKSVTAGELRDVPGNDWSKLWKGWDALVSRLVRELEAEAAKNSRGTRNGALSPLSAKSSFISDTGSPEDAEDATTPTLSPMKGNVVDAETIAKNIAALKARNKARLTSPSPRSAGKKGGGKNGAASPASESSDAEGTPKRASTPSKMARKWDDAGSVSTQDMASLDFSSQAAADGQEDDSALDSLVDTTALGKRGKDGMYEVADYQDKRGEDDADSILARLAADKLSAQDSKEGKNEKPASAFSSFFTRIGTSAGLTSKAITAQDLQTIMNAMREHLMNKNVARDIADKICDGVSQSLVGKKVSGFGDGGVRAEVRRALEESLTRILTSKTSTDILLDVTRKKQAQSAAAGKKDPYAITFVGVNGVGKSTNLSKVAFWLLQNRLKVLIAACDTFRSGAVEQLRVHVRNLGKLKVLNEDEDNAQGRIELFEKGYGKDAAGIAKDAIAYAKDHGFDVVLVDTAGRMQDNEPLMRALAKLVSVNQPDKIFFVGEAVVGNEAVDQLTKFNRSLRDFSGVSSAKARGIDGMILTKMDIIDDKVGAALSMTYVTGQPIVFIGTGQTYTDLKAMKVGHVVNALMRN